MNKGAEPAPKLIRVPLIPVCGYFHHIFVGRRINHASQEAHKLGDEAWEKLTPDEIADLQRRSDLLKAGAKVNRDAKRHREDALAGERRVAARDALLGAGIVALRCDTLAEIPNHLKSVAERCNCNRGREHWPVVANLNAVFQHAHQLPENKLRLFTLGASLVDQQLALVPTGVRDRIFRQPSSLIGQPPRSICTCQAPAGLDD